MKNIKRLWTINNIIGEPDSDRIRYLKDRISDVDGHDYNCAHTSLYLIGLEEAGYFVYSPMEGLYRNGSKLVFFRENPQDYVTFKDVDTEEELRTMQSFVCPSTLKIGYGNGEIDNIWGLYEKRNECHENIIVDPVNAIKDKKQLWSRLKNLLNEQKIISQLTYRIRPGDKQLKLDHFHQSVLFSNKDKYYGIDKFLFGRQEISLTTLDIDSYYKFVKPFEEGLHFFAINGENIPPL